MSKIDIMFTDNKVLNNQLIGNIIIDGVKTNQVTTVNNVVNMISGTINGSTGFLSYQETPVFNMFHTVNNNNELNIYFSTATELYKPYVEQLKTYVLPQIIQITLKATTKDEAEKRVNNQIEVIRPLEEINEVVDLFNQGNVTNIYTNNDFDRIIYEILIKDGRKYQIVVPSNTIPYNEQVINRLNSLISRINHIVQEPVIEQVGIIQEKLPTHQNTDTSVANNILLRPQEADAFPINYNNTLPINKAPVNIFNQPVAMPAMEQPVPTPIVNQSAPAATYEKPTIQNKTRYNRSALSGIKNKTVSLLTFANIHRATKINIDQNKAYI